MILRLRYQKFGAHIHCRLFTAPGPDRTFAKCGDLVFSEQEWPEVVATFERGGAELVPEGERSAVGEPAR